MLTRFKIEFEIETQMNEEEIEHKIRSNFSRVYLLEIEEQED